MTQRKTTCAADGNGRGGTYFAHPLNLDRLSTNGDVAQNNTIKFTSANYAGLQFGGTYSFSNNTNFGNNRAYSAGVAYQFQGLKLAGAYSQANLGDGTNANGATSSAIGGIASQGRVRTYGAAAGYAFGPAQVGAAWTQARLDNNAVGVGTLRTDNYEVNAKYNLTPALGLGAAYTYTNAKINNGSTHWNQFGLQADYALSKRTDVYAQAVYQRAAKNGIGASIYNGSNFSDNLPSRRSTKPQQRLVCVTASKRDGGVTRYAASKRRLRAPFRVRPAWAHSCGWKSRHKLITANEVKRNCMRVTECGKEAWIANREPMDKNRIEGAAEQGERARNREALVIKAKRRRCDGCAMKECVLTWGDLASCLKGRRRQAGARSQQRP